MILMLFNIDTPSADSLRLVSDEFLERVLTEGIDAALQSR